MLRARARGCGECTRWGEVGVPASLLGSGSTAATPNASCGDRIELIRVGDAATHSMVVPDQRTSPASDVARLIVSGSAAS